MEHVLIHSNIMQYERAKTRERVVLNYITVNLYTHLITGISKNNRKANPNDLFVF